MARLKREKSFNFESGLIELEKIVKDMEEGALTLEASLQRFGQAIHLLQQCQATLKQAEQHVQILLHKDQEVILEPFTVHESCV